MVRRILSLILLAWIFGFVWFAVFLPQPLGPAKTDVVVVLTGGEGRIDRSLEVLRKGWAPRLLVSGVDREVRPSEYAVQYKVSRALMECCITLGFASVDTRSNAQEAADWVEKRKARSVRLITTDWHVRRAAMEFSHRLPPDVRLVRDAVPSHPTFRNLFLEYNKLLARWFLGIVGL